MSNKSKIMDDVEHCVFASIRKESQEGKDHFIVGDIARSCGRRVTYEIGEEAFSMRSSIMSKLLPKLNRDVSEYTFGKPSNEWKEKYDYDKSQDDIIKVHYKHNDFTQKEIESAAKKNAFYIENLSWDDVAHNISKYGHYGYTIYNKNGKNNDNSAICDGKYCGIVANSLGVGEFEKAVENKVNNLLEGKELFVKIEFSDNRDSFVMNITADLEKVINTPYDEISEYYKNAVNCVVDQFMTKSKIHCINGYCTIKNLRSKCDPRFYVNNDMNNFKGAVAEAINMKYESVNAFVENDLIRIIPVVPNIKE